MEGPGRLRSKTATVPVPMRCQLSNRYESGCHIHIDAGSLRQPRASDRGRGGDAREVSQVWGSLDHQKCPADTEIWGRGLSAAAVSAWPAIRGQRSRWSLMGTMALASNLTPCSWTSPEVGEGDAPGKWGAHLAWALGKGDAVFCPGTFHSRSHGPWGQ